MGVVYLEALRDSFLQELALPRHRDWPKVRDKFLEGNPRCTVCGGVRYLTAHHRHPFHLFPERELDQSNLQAICEEGPGGMNCHLVVGHGGNWRDYNRWSLYDARRIYQMILNRVRG